MSAIFWATNDGRQLDIKWMQTQHLVNSVNMVIRKNDMDSAQATRFMVLRSTLNNGKHVFGHMMHEIEQRCGLNWTAVQQHQQLVIPPHSREPHLIMCMQRAMLDTGVFWPDHFKQKYCLEILRFQPDFIDACLAEAASKPTPELDRLVTKFAEYRLLPPVNGA